MTDGSMIRLRAISPRRPFIVLPVDSMTHPSWIGTHQKGGPLVDEQGRLAKFRARFGGMDEALMLGANQITGLSSSSTVIKEQDNKITINAKAKAASKGKKK